MANKRLISLTETQAELLEQLMKETYQRSPSALMVYLMVNYQHNKPNKRGRPSTKQNDKDDDEDRTKTIYKSPDYDQGTKSPYSKDDVDVWWDAHPRETPPTDEAELYQLHPLYAPKD